jgi:hypothetical protein
MRLSGRMEKKGPALGFAQGGLSRKEREISDACDAPYFRRSPV